MANSADHHRNHFYLHRSPSVGLYPMYYNGAQISDHFTPNFSVHQHNISHNPYPLSKLNSQCCNKFNCSSPTTGIKTTSPDKINNLKNIITSSSNGKSQSNFFPKSKWSLSKSVGHDIGGFTRKWSDFVPKFARRNVDNKVYRSESFRFIQKTDSFLSPRASVPLRGILKNGKQMYPKPEVPVSDYVEPLDRLLLHSNLNSTSISNNSNSSTPSDTSSAKNTTASSSNSNTSSNISNTSSSKCINTSNSLSDKEYQEIKENCHNINYNAPYYYSDTLKEDPTYILPCSNTGTSTSSNKKPPPPLPTSPPPNCTSSKDDGPSGVGGGGGLGIQGRPGELLETSLDQSMARKKYETAFLPTNIQSSNNANKACSPSEVDALLLSIDSRAFFNNLRSANSTTTANNATKVVIEGEESILPDNLISNCTTARSRQPLTPQIELSDRPALDLIAPKININKPNTTNISSHHNVHSTPLSEPLPCKRFSSIQSTSQNSSSSCKDNARVSMMKDNSISSLESLGSTKSEDLSRLRSSQVRKAKLLSPISDKSPLEPTSSMHTLDTKDLHCNTHQWTTTRDLLTTSEYANVPWEMPKLRRKLALLADSGISLDSSGGEGGGGDGYQQIVQLHQHQPPRPARGKMDFGRVNLELRLSGDCDETVQQQQRYDEAGELYLGDCEGQLADLSLQQQKPDRFRMKLDFNSGDLKHQDMYEIDTSLELECQDWFFGAITRSEAESTLRSTKEGSFLVRNCESSTFNRYSLSIKSARGFIHIRIEPNSLGTFSLGENEFPTVAHLVLHFMSNRLPIKGAEHVRLKYPVITQLL